MGWEEPTKWNVDYFIFLIYEVFQIYFTLRITQKAFLIDQE